MIGFKKTAMVALLASAFSISTAMADTIIYDTRAVNNGEPLPMQNESEEVLYF